MSRKNSRQNKLQRKARKTAKNERRERERRRDTTPAPSILRGLAEADELLEDGELEAAVEVLEELHRRFPHRREPLEALLEPYMRCLNMWGFQAVCRRLVELDRSDAEIWLALAGAALGNAQPAAALQAFDEFLSLSPDSPMAADTGRARDDIEEFLRAEIAKLGLPEAEGFEVFALHDELDFHLHRGEYERVCEVAELLLSRWPTFAPALNNRSEAQFRLGRLDQAIADARRVLEFDPGNFHALGNLTRFLVLAGQTDKAAASARQLKAAVSTSADLFVKQAETLASLGDWPGVLDALAAAQRAGRSNTPTENGMLYHLAGVAAANLGQLDAARKHWKRALKLQPTLSLAAENLQDAKQPPGEQNGPWAFGIDHWISRALVEQLAAETDRGERQIKDDELRRRVRKFFERHPELERVAPLLLYDGDPMTKEFVVRLGGMSQSQGILSALKEFAFGRRGTDKLRHQAALALIDAGILAPGKHRMWMQGELRDVILMSYEITAEPTDPIPADAEPIADKGRQALHEGDGSKSERLFAQALRLHPNHPSLKYNLAVAIGLEGREAEALAQVREIHSQHPHYLFARVRLAHEAVERRDFDAARSLLDPIMTRSRFHIGEYTALCDAHIALLEAEGNLDGARSWLKMWADVDDEDPRLELWRRRLKPGGLLSRFVARD